MVVILVADVIALHVYFSFYLEMQYILQLRMYEISKYNKYTKWYVRPNIIKL